MTTEKGKGEKGKKGTGPEAGSNQIDKSATATDDKSHFEVERASVWRFWWPSSWRARAARRKAAKAKSGTPSGNVPLLRPLEIDAWLDSSAYRLIAGLKWSWASLSDFMARFRLRGLRRLGLEIVSDGLNLATLGLLLIMALAQPALRATQTDWLTRDDFSVTFLDRQGREIGKRGVLHDDAVPLHDMPDYLIKAALATEDRRFFSHFGIDFIGTARAMLTNLRQNAVVEGGSTITQQLAKNLFLSSERTLERKIEEAFLALWLEINLSKEEILKLYLDRTYMGGGAFGVEAAANFYFGKTSREISLPEAAMLVGLFKAPTHYAPHVDLARARARANEVLDNLVEAGFMNSGEIMPAKNNPASVVDRLEADSPNYFLDWAFEQIKALAGQHSMDRTLLAYTTFDSNLQNLAEYSVEAHLRQYGDEYQVYQAALVAMEADGAVRAMVGGRDYGASQFNRATDALRQPGSSFKPIVYMTAIDAGLTPDTVLNDSPVRYGNWQPKNYDRRYRGRVRLHTALTRSINIIPIKLAQQLGRGKVAQNAKNMGITSPIRVNPSMPLGTSEASVIDMATVYSVFASGGQRIMPYAITHLRNMSGDIVYRRSENAAQPKQLFARGKVETMNRLLQNVVEAGTGRRARLNGIAAAGKTGTTQSHRDAWFVGFTGNLVTAVWFGNDDFTPTRRLTGGRLPAMTWQHFMQNAHRNLELKLVPGLKPKPVSPDAAPGAQVLVLDDTPVTVKPLQILGHNSALALDDIHSDMHKVLSTLTQKSANTTHLKARRVTPLMLKSRRVNSPIITGSTKPIQLN